MSQYSTLIFLLFFCYTALFSQRSTEKKIFDLINEARTNPKTFLKNYKKDLRKDFVEILKKASPIEKVSWDAGIEAMCKDYVINKNLNPTYPKDMEKSFCFSTSGSGTGNYRPKESAIKFIQDFYSIINEATETHFAMYFKDGNYSFRWAGECNSKKRVPFTYDRQVDTSKVDFEALNTAKDAPNLSKEEIEMIQEVNFARAYPMVYADIAGAHMAKHSKRFGGLGKEELYATNELINYLREMKPVSILKHKDCLQEAAQKHSSDLLKRGHSGHIGSDGSNSWDRIQKTCGKSGGNENISSSTNSDVRFAIVSLLVDSGISMRGHRHNMLNKKWNYIGVARVHGKMENELIMTTYVQNFVE